MIPSIFRRARRTVVLTSAAIAVVSGLVVVRFVTAQNPPAGAQAGANGVEPVLGSVLNPTYAIHDPVGLAKNPPDPNVRCIVPARWQAADVKWMHDVAPHNKIDDAIDAAAPGSLHDIMVNFRTPVADSAGVMTQSLQPALTGKGVVQFVGAVIPTIAMSGVSVADIQALAARPDVAFIQEQRVYHPLIGIACQDTKVRGPFYSPNTVEDQFPTVFDFSSGTAVNIAIVDTGADDPGGPGTTNADLPSAVHVYDAFAQAFNNPDDQEGHGTHVAGIALGRGTTLGSAPVPRGVAAGVKSQDTPGNVVPGAGLIDVKVLGPNGGTDASILGGLQVLTFRKTAWNVGVINMSLGRSFPDDGTDAICQAVDRATAAGIVVVVSAGNDGPSNLGLGSPAAANTAITVASYDDNETATRDDDAISSFSSRGPRTDNGDLNCLDELKPEVAAPGATGPSAPDPDGILSAKWNTAADGIRFAGTSMAAPHVAGICALMLSANPELTPDQVKQMLISTALPRGTSSSTCPLPPGVSTWNRAFGYGMVDALEAVKMALANSSGQQQHQCVSSLTLLSPLGNVTLIKKTTQRITWTFTGSTADQIDIFLNSAGSYVGAIAKAVNVNTNGYDWIVGSALDTNQAIPQGSAYSITIRPSFDCGSNNVAPTSTSPSFFSIIDSVVALATPPNANTSTTPAVVAVAPGGKAILGALAADGTVITASKGMPPYTYLWSPQDNLDDATLARPTVTPTRSVRYTVTVRDATGQTASDSVDVVVANPLIVSAGPNKTFRVGGTVVLEGSASGGSPPYTYQWSPTPDPTLQPGQNGANIAQPAARPSQTTTYTLTVTDSLSTGKGQSASMIASLGLAVTLVNNPGNAGAITRDVVKDIYFPGDRLRLTAEPNAGWIFDHWESPGIEFDNKPANTNTPLAENPTPITLHNLDAQVTAVYRAITPSNPPGTGGGTSTGGGTTAGPGCFPLAPASMLGMLFGLGLLRRSFRRHSRAK